MSNIARCRALAVLAALMDDDEEEDETVMETDSNGNIRWVMNGMDHRVDGPAIVSHGVETWCYEGYRHREDGPAVIWANGDNEWWIHGDPINSYAELQDAIGYSDEDIVALKLKWGKIIPCR